MKKLLLLLTVLTVYTGYFAGFTAQAQIRLKVSSFQNKPDTMEVGKQVSFKIAIRNTGNQSFTGTPDVFFKTDTMIQPNYMYAGFPWPPVTIQPGDSTVVTTFFTPKSSEFRIGKNIVVIWPSALSVQADTIKLPIVAIPHVGIKEESLAAGISIYPVPVKNILNIKFQNNINIVEQVRILNMLGQEMNVPFYSSNSINTSELEPGIYFLHFRFKNRPPAVYRFSKQ